VARVRTSHTTNIQCRRPCIPRIVIFGSAPPVETQTRTKAVLQTGQIRNSPTILRDFKGRRFQRSPRLTATCQCPTTWVCPRLVYWCACNPLLERLPGVGAPVPCGSPRNVMLMLEANREVTFLTRGNPFFRGDGGWRGFCGVTVWQMVNGLHCNS
jgi:hypothetical protein